MTSEHPLKQTGIELHRILENGERKVVYFDRRLQAIIDKLAALGAEIEDPHTGSVTVHLGQERGDVVRVKVQVEKTY